MHQAVWEGDAGLMVDARSKTAESVVLVVDDDASVRGLLQDIISAHGNKVVTVGSAEEAVEQVKKQHFLLIFLDWKLPGMSGIEALSAIKAEDERAVVVIITGYGDNLKDLENVSWDTQLLISKPFQIRDIVDVLNKVNAGEKLNNTSHSG
jgi:two-component system response regulator AtoC